MGYILLCSYVSGCAGKHGGEIGCGEKYIYHVCYKMRDFVIDHMQIIGDFVIEEHNQAVNVLLTSPFYKDIITYIRIQYDKALLQEGGDIYGISGNKYQRIDCKT